MDDDRYLLARQVAEEARKLGAPVKSTSPSPLGAFCVVGSLYVYVQIDLLLERIRVLWTYNEKVGQTWKAPLASPNVLSRAAMMIMETYEESVQRAANRALEVDVLKKKLNQIQELETLEQENAQKKKWWTESPVLGFGGGQSPRDFSKT